MTWRGIFSNAEVNRLHAEAFGARCEIQDQDWRRLVDSHSLGWVTARAVGDDTAAGLLGFVNVVWDGLVHAWIQDVMVAETARHQGIGRQLVSTAADAAR